MSDLPVILLAFANEQQKLASYLRNLPEELRQVESILKSERAENLCLTEILTNATLETILAKFDKYGSRIKVFHYAGHASPEGLFLESADGSRIAFAEGLAKYLGTKGVQLVFLNGCSTGPQALAMHDAGVDCVIATSRSIDDAAATGFSVRFYQELVNGHPFADAFALASDILCTTTNKEANGFVRQAEATRFIGPKEISDDHGLPWKILVRAGAEAVGRITLPQLAGAPLLGLPPLPAPEYLEPMPYRYLQPFTADFAHVFFGRGQAIADLYNRVISPDSPRVVFYSGPTGVGKSSVLDAGLLPRLKLQREVLYVRRDSNAGLLGTLRRALNLPADSALADDLALAWSSADKPDRPLVVILDQAEEAFTRPHKPSGTPQAEIDTLVTSLKRLFEGTARGSKGRLMLGFRKEWLQEFEHSFESNRLGYDSVSLAPLDYDGIVEAIEGPSISPTPAVKNFYNLHVEDGLANAIAAHLVADAGSALAPTLQVLLSKMWATAGGKGAKFTFDLYDAMKSKGILLDDILKQGLEHLAESQPNAAKSGFGLDLLEFHTTELGTAETRSLNELVARYPHRTDLNETIGALESGYLLVGSEAPKPADPLQKIVDTSRRTRLCHDTLAPLVQKEFRQSQLPGPRASRLLAARAQGWKDGKTGETLSEIQLQLVEEGLPATGTISGDPKTPGQLSPEARCVESSRLEVMQSKEKELKRTRLIKALQYAAAMASVIAIYFGVNSQTQKNEALAQKVAAEKQAKIANEAREDSEFHAANVNLVLAANLFEQGHDMQAKKTLLSIPEEKRTFPWGLLKQEISNRSFVLGNNNNGYVLSVAWSADGQKIATSSADGTIKLWNAINGQLLFNLEGHAESTNSVTFSADNRKLASCSNDSTIRLWDIYTGREILKFDISNHRVMSLSFSPDGQKLVFLCDDSTIRSLDLNSKTEKVIIAKQNLFILCMALSPDGRTLATGSIDNTILLWDMATGNETNKLIGHSRYVNELSFSPDGLSLASGSDDKTIKLWDISSGKEIANLIGHENTIRTLSFSPDGLLLGSGSSDYTIRIWDVRKQDCKTKLVGHRFPVESLVFSPDGLSLASGSADSTFRLWDIKSGVEKANYAGHQGPILTLSVSPDGKTLASGSYDKSIRLWDLLTGKEKVKLIGHKGEVSCLSISKDGQTLASGSFDNTIRLWNISTGELCLELTGHVDQVTAISYSKDGKTLVSSSNDHTIRLWDIETGLLRLVLLGHKAAVNTIVLSPDGTTIASGSGDNTIKLWNVTNGQEKSCKLIQNEVTSLVFSPNGRFLVYGLVDGTIGSLDLETFQSTSGKRFAHSLSVTSLAFSPDGNQLASSSLDKTIKIWDFQNLSELTSLLGHEDFVTCLFFSPNGSTLISGSDDNTIRLWDLSVFNISYHYLSVISNDGTCIASVRFDGTIQISDTISGFEKSSFRFTGEPVVLLRFSPDNQRLATVSSDNIIRIWNLETGQLKSLLSGHNDVISFIIFSQDGRTLASASYDKSIILWDLDTGENKARLQGHQSEVMTLSFSPDGRTLASGAGDYTIRLWDLLTKKEKLKLTSNQGTSLSLDFSPNGEFLAAGAGDGNIWIWEVLTGNKTTILKDGIYGVQSISFSPDCRTIASVSSTNTVNLWDMGTGMLVRKIRFNSIGQVFSVFFVKNLPFDSAKNCRLFVDGDFEKHVLKVEYGTFDALIQREEQIARNFLRFYPFYDEAIAAIRRNETLSTEEKDRIAGIIQPLIDFQHGQAAAKGIPLPDNLFQQ